MKRITLSFAVATAMFFSFQSFAQSTWTIDKAHSKVGFTISHLMINDVDGEFKNFEAKIKAPKADFTDASVEMSADVASINTDNEKRDGHLQSPDFFDASKFNKVTFKSTSFKKGKGDNYVFTGELTMHGVTKTVKMDATCKMGNDPMSKKAIASFQITKSKINRKDFGIGAGMPSAMLGEDVAMNIKTLFTKD
jgi:polyisoprenoid-binding protein YceI